MSPEDRGRQLGHEANALMEDFLRDHLVPALREWDGDLEQQGHLMEAFGAVTIRQGEILMGVVGEALEPVR